MLRLLVMNFSLLNVVTSLLMMMSGLLMVMARLLVVMSCLLSMVVRQLVIQTFVFLSSSNTTQTDRAEEGNCRKRFA